MREQLRIIDLVRHILERKHMGPQDVETKESLECLAVLGMNKDAGARVAEGNTVSEAVGHECQRESVIAFKSITLVLLHRHDSSIECSSGLVLSGIWISSSKGVFMILLAWA